jgi:hypothetical protein
MELIITIALTASVTTIISMVGFWLVKSRHYVSKEEVDKIIELKQLLKDTVEVIGDLKLELRTLKVVLDNVVVQQNKYEQILSSLSSK